MRRPTLNRWLKKEILILSAERRFSLRRLAALAQNEQPRLAAPLFLYCYETESLETLYGFVYDPETMTQYRIVESMLDGKNLSNVALDANIPDGLPRDYSKHLTSFAAAYHAPETAAESKRLRWERSHALQLEKGIPTAQIYRALGMNPGNVNAYMKHGDIGKVSLEGATAIMRYLISA